MVDDFTFEDYPNGTTLTSRDQFKNAISGWAQALSDGKLVNATYHDAGDTSVAQFVMEGTNDGPFGNRPATGRRVSLPVCEIMHFDAEGRMRSGAVYFDLMSMLVQLGHMEPPQE